MAEEGSRRREALGVAQTRSRQLLSALEVEALLDGKIKVRTLANWRSAYRHGKPLRGPRFKALGGKILYPIESVEEWMEGHGIGGRRSVTESDEQDRRREDENGNGRDHGRPVTRRHRGGSNSGRDGAPNSVQAEPVGPALSHTHLGQRFELALLYALHVHGGHVRKAARIPYFSHVMAVAATVIENGGTETQAIAALLHDAVEDQGGGPRLNDIRDRFGPDVAAIVEACSDSLNIAPDGRKDWFERKKRYLRDLPHKPTPVLLVTCADKLHNARAICRDVAEIGPALWGRFGKPAEQTIAYYSAFHRILRECYCTAVAAELGQAVQSIESFIADAAAHSRFVKQLLSE